MFVDDITKFIQEVHVGTYFRDKRKTFTRVKFCGKFLIPGDIVDLTMLAKERFGSRLIKVAPKKHSPIMGIRHYQGTCVFIKHVTC